MDELKAFDANPIKQLQQKYLQQDCCVRVCGLCLRKTDMPVVYEDEHVWISYGKKTRKCLVVWKEHKPEITEDEYNLVSIGLYKAFPKIRNFNIKRCAKGSQHWYCTVSNIKYEGS